MHVMQRVPLQKHLENMNVNLQFPGLGCQYTLTLVKIPDPENVIMDASNAIDQLMPLKENTIS